MISAALVISAMLGVLVPKMTEVPAGYFYMGAEGVTADYNPDEAPIHRVEISQPFMISTFEVTNAEYECFDRSHRKLRGQYGFSSADDEAVVYVSWDDAMNYCKWLSKKTGKTYRLPTEAEWEYACKAGTVTTYSWGGSFKAELSKNNVPGAEEKRLFEPLSLTSLKSFPNAWGLYDMHGNVEEWCLDWYGPYRDEAQKDPVGPDGGDFRVTRGGSHTTSPTYLRSTNRSAMPPADRSFAVGFRVVQADYPGTEPYPEIKLAEDGVSQESCQWAETKRQFFKAPLTYVKAATDGVRMFRHNHEPAICWCPNGDLLAIWFSTDSEFGREMTILSSRLPKGSREWTAPRQFFKIPDRNMTGLSLFYDDKSGAIIHLSGYDALGWWRNEAVVERRSYDNGVTWTRPEVVMSDHRPGHQLVAGMSRTPDGRLLQICDAGPGGEDGSVLHISKDNGATWTEAPALIEGIHAGCVALKDGSLLAFGRCKGVPGADGVLRMPQSISKDNGRSWTVSPSCFPPIRGGQRLVLMRLREGPLMLISFANEGNPWRGMFASLSYDEAATWTPWKLITDGVERCLDGGAWTGTFIMDSQHAEPKGYLAATQTPDGMIHLISSKNYYSFNLQWLEADSEPVPVIFDTDMGNDIDDALALAMLYRYTDEGLIDLIGIPSSKTDMTSVAYVDIVGNYYGHPDIPIGKLTGIEQYVRLNTYAEKMVASGRWKGSVPDYDALPESADLMKTLLEGQKDHSVVIVAVGFFTNLSRLLTSDPGLVARKVKKLVLMAGDFNEKDRSVEHNVRYDIPATQHICREWPSEIVLSPFQVGLDVLYPVGTILDNMGFPTPNPVAEAYKVYKKMPYDRPTWDLSAVLYAVDGAELFESSGPGTITVDDEGRTWFTPASDGKHSYISVPAASRETILARYLDLTTRP